MAARLSACAMRTRGFPSQPYDWFGFVSQVLPILTILNIEKTIKMRLLLYFAPLSTNESHRWPPASTKKGDVLGPANTAPPIPTGVRMRTRRIAFELRVDPLTPPCYCRHTPGAGAPPSDPGRGRHTTRGEKETATRHAHCQPHPKTKTGH